MTKVIIDPEQIEVDDETGEITLITPQFISAYRHDKARSRSFATTNTEESMTQQSDAADCDINVIMKKYGPTGQFPQTIGKAIYGDFSNITDYRSMVDRMDELNEAFMEVPAAVRSRFNNDPQEFITWATDPKNLDDVRKAGLAPPAPTVVTTTSAPGAPGASATSTTAPATPTQSTPSQPSNPATP